MKDLFMIACISKDYGLGKSDQLLWQIPEDMKFFRATTQGSMVIMGRKTFESIGHALPGRRNVVLSSRRGAGGATTDKKLHDVQNSAHDVAQKATQSNAQSLVGNPAQDSGSVAQNPAGATQDSDGVEWCTREELDVILRETPGKKFIIGGASLYEMFLPEAERLYLTEVDGTKPADTWFPKFERSEWARRVLQTGEADDIKYEMVEYYKGGKK